MVMATAGVMHIMHLPRRDMAHGILIAKERGCSNGWLAEEWGVTKAEIHRTLMWAKTDKPLLLPRIKKENIDYVRSQKDQPESGSVEGRPGVQHGRQEPGRIRIQRKKKVPGPLPKQRSLHHNGIATLASMQHLGHRVRTNKRDGRHIYVLPAELAMYHDEMQGWPADISIFVKY